ncbi:MAG: hypothetical protein AAFX86_09285 [Pseudomonadota bacterium]
MSPRHAAMYHLVYLGMLGVSPDNLMSLAHIMAFEGTSVTSA